MGLMDIKDTENVMTQGKEVFVKANHLSNMNYTADMEMLKDCITEYFEDFNYLDLHSFVQNFYLQKFKEK